MQISTIKNKRTKKSNLHNGYEYVDLGLPSGLLWATCNIGAYFIEDYGNYFAWGETFPKQKRNDIKNSSLKRNDKHIKYNAEDQKTELDPEDDVAHVIWGGNWRMPTIEEFDELCEHCTWRWTNNYKKTGVSGRIGKSKINGNTIFLPAAGYRCEDKYHFVDYYADYYGYHGYYWSRSQSRMSGSVNYAGCFQLASKFVHTNPYGGRRDLGLSVRAVCPRIE